MENSSKPIFIARKLKDAKALEAVFEAAGVEYEVEPDEYLAGIVFRTMRVGAFFYVRPEIREKAISVMLENGYVPAG
jgi:hypothetical protein